MTTFHLGVDDIPYAIGGKTATTGQVAGILEANYGVMRTFLELHEQEIADAIGLQMKGMIDNAKAGSPLNYGVIKFDDVKALFAEYLDTGEWDATSGQPTAAALAGHRHSHKSVTANGKGARPSFIDTGTYRNSMQAWMTK